TMQLREDEFARIGHTAAVLQRASLHIDDAACPALRDVIARCRSLKARVPALRLLVVDFVQLLSGVTENRAEALRSISYGLKGLAKELSVALIALAVESLARSADLPDALRRHANGLVLPATIHPGAAAGIQNERARTSAARILEGARNRF